MKLEGKAALISGASRGVGRATALALAQAGCAVAINYNESRDAAEKTAEAARELGVRACCVQGDVASDAACRRIVDGAAGELGRLDILVNNAGTTRFISHDRLEEVTDEDWERIFGVNLKGPFQCVRAARKYLEASGEGVVVNVASIAGIAAAGSSIPYCASKAALINMTISLARVLGPKVRVNAVAPGFIAGDWTLKGYGSNYERAAKSYENRAALGKVCQPEEVAEVIVSLIMGPHLVTGQTLVCDAGAMIGPKP